MEEIGTVTQQI